MKKTLVSALTTALVVGAASTTFAAANPFSDVPADHWAYDAIAQLAADGVIEGYGDGTYRGDQEITRYEMAQMVARAMAKNPSGVDKAYVDKLAAEFSEELNNLGVRVSALEKKVDNVKWPGKIRFRFTRRNQEHTAKGTHLGNNNALLLRFEPEMKINEHWTGKARIDYNNIHEMKDAKNYDKVKVDRIYVQGDYKNFQVKLGKLPYKSQADYGLFVDQYFTGGQVVFGSNIKVALNAGRMYNDDDIIYKGQKIVVDKDGNEIGKSNYLGIEVYNNRKDKFTWGLGFHNLKMQEFDGLFDNKNMSIFTLGLGYKFTPDWSLTGAYTKALKVDEPEGAVGWSWKSEQKQSYSFELAYKGAVASKPGSWGAFIAYRHAGAFSSLYHTYKLNGPMDCGEKGFEIGASWAPMKNFTAILRYFNGKKMGLTSDDAKDPKVSAIFSEFNFLF